VNELLIERQPVLDGCLSIVVAGDFDMATAAQVEAAIYNAITDPQVKALVLDLAKVGFLDSVGIRVLLHGRQRAAEHNITFRVTNPEGVVRTVLHITGVLTMLTDEA
jgi:anti-sigma B factor antagonist